MKKLCMICSLLVLLSIAGCGKKPYELKNPVDKIERIEIVLAEDSLTFSVVKTLSETETTDFIKKLQTIKFDSYFLGDPISVNGNAVKITYQNGDYEMICYRWSEYVKNDEVYFIRKSCDEKEFNSLLNSFLE